MEPVQWIRAAAPAREVMEATLEYYEKNAAVIAPGYDAASAGVSALFPFVFKPGQRVLDIGAGSGRDMDRLLSLGIDAYGIEPSESMEYALPIRSRVGRGGRRSR